MITNIEKLLINKLKKWTLEDTDAFHNHVNRHHQEGMYMWDRTCDGVFIWRDIGAHFISNTGEVSKITKWFSKNDWFLHQELYRLSQETREFRIEIPLEARMISINGQDLYFSKVQRPNYELGEDFQLDLFRGIVTKDYFIEFIDTSVYPIKNLKQLDKMYKMGVPAVRFPVSRRVRDSKGYFWADLKQWTIPFEIFIESQFNDLNFVLGILEKNFMFKKTDSDIIREYANIVWRSI